MATVGEAIAATLIAQWNAGTGGTRPDPIQYLVERPERDPNPTVADAIYVWLPLRRTFDPIDVAEVYRNVTYTLRIVCHTKTSSARQLEIENEVDRILNSGTVITGATRQRVKEINDISNRSYSNLPKYISEVIMEVFTAMEVSATAYGTATTTTLVTDELTVNTHITGLGLTITTFLDEDNMASDAADAFASQQSIKAYVDAQVGAHDAFKTFTGITNDVVADQPEDSITFTSGNNRLTIVGTTATDTVTFTLDESKIDHDALTNFAANEHFTEASISHDSIDDVSASDHHTKWTTGDTEGVITAELVNGQSIDNAIDALITTHTNIEAAHGMEHDDLTDTSLTGAYLEDLLMNGTVIKPWINLIPMIDSDSYNKVNVSGARSRWISADNGITKFALPMAPIKSGLKLNADRIRYYLQQGDSNDYINEVELHGFDYDTDGTSELLFENTVNDITPGARDIDMTAGNAVDLASTDISGYTAYCAFLRIVSDGADTSPELSWPQIRCWYAP